MSNQQQGGPANPPPEQGGIGGHVLVAVCACILTVAIVGSSAFLTYRIYTQHQWQTKVRAAVASLQNRTSAELAETAAHVKAQPKLTRLVLPEVLRSLRESKSEEQQCSAIQVLRVFVNHRRVERALFRLRRDGRESVSSAAVRALTDVRPPEHAAELLGRCLEDAAAKSVTDAVVDEACAGLYRLAEVGLPEMEKRLSRLSIDRRIWLVGYVSEKGGPGRRIWLEMLQSDDAMAVRAAAERALGMSGDRA